MEGIKITYQDEAPSSQICKLSRDIRGLNGPIKSPFTVRSPVKVGPRVSALSSSSPNTNMPSNVIALSQLKATPQQNSCFKDPKSPMQPSSGPKFPPIPLRETYNGNTSNDTLAMPATNVKALESKSDSFPNPIHLRTRISSDNPPSKKANGSNHIHQAKVRPTSSLSTSSPALSNGKPNSKGKRQKIILNAHKDLFKIKKKRKKWYQGDATKKKRKRKVKVLPENELKDEKEPTVITNNDQTSFFSFLGMSKNMQLPDLSDDLDKKPVVYQIMANGTSVNDPKSLRVKFSKRKQDTSEESNLVDEVSTTKKKRSQEYNCECEEVSRLDKLTSTPTGCQGVEVIGPLDHSCKNEATNELTIRMGTSLKFCNLHVARKMSHNACPGCGKFVGEGLVYYCMQEQQETPHLAHVDCFSDKPTECPHCGNLSVLVANAVISIKTGKISRKKNVSSNKTKIRRLIDKLEINEDNIPKGFSAEDVHKVIEEFRNMEPRCHKTRTLYWPVKQGKNVKVLCMLTSGHSVMQKLTDDDKSTPLHISASEGHVLTTYFLLQAGAEIDALDKNFRSPLLVACMEGKPEIVKFLLTSGADYNIKDKDGMTCIHLAASHGQLSCVRAILGNQRIPKNFINMKDSGRYTPLAWACEYERFEVVKYLVDRGADLHSVDVDGNIALHWASYAGSREICELLILWGNDINLPNFAGDTPVHIAFRRKQSQCLSLFALHKPNMALKNARGQTPDECLPSNENKDCNTWAKILAARRTFYAISGQDHERIVCNDLSKGKEEIPVQVVNGVDDASMPNDFTYTTKRIQKLSFTVKNYDNEMEHCKCEGPCSMGDCQCSGRLYGIDGRLSESFGYKENVVFNECNDLCNCSVIECLNRVVQNGPKVRLQIFRTPNKGWGVRAAHDIPKGSFVSEYVGELITKKESNSKNRDDSYYFELEAEHSYCIDARHLGNASRFINHSCDPNLLVVKVFTDSQDARFPRIALFTNRDIAMGEELNYNYGQTFWSPKLKHFTCNCGADKCLYRTLKK